MAGEVLTCVDFDVSTQSCTSQAWLPQPSFLPVLSVADASLLASAIIFNWCYAYAWNRAEKVIRQ